VTERHVISSVRVSMPDGSQLVLLRVLSLSRGRHGVSSVIGHAGVQCVLGVQPAGLCVLPASCWLEEDLLACVCNIWLLQPSESASWSAVLQWMWSCCVALTAYLGN
jgi:hypothetical protein